MPPRKPKQPKAEMLRSNLALNEGHVTAREIVIPDPEDGSRRVVARVTNGREIDRLHAERKITDLQHAAATAWRDAWEASDVTTGRVVAASWSTRIQGASGGLLRGSAKKRAVHEIAYRQAGRDCRNILRAIVLDDQSIETWSRAMRHSPDGALAILRIGLDRVARALKLVSS